MLLTITLILVCIVCIGLIFTNQALFDFVIGSIVVLSVVGLFIGVFGVGVYLLHEVFNSWPIAILGGLFIEFMLLFYWNEWWVPSEEEYQAQIRQAYSAFLKKQHLYPPKPH